MKIEISPVAIPDLINRIGSVWFRHMKVYTRNLFSNAFPPFIEPVIFLVGIGFGLGLFIQGNMDGIPYILFLATGLIVSPAMFTAAFECTYGTFVRLEYDKVYDGMLGAPLTYKDVIWGEVLWCGTKGFVFSLSVVIIVMAFGIIKNPLAILAPFIGLITGLMFSVLSLFITTAALSENLR